MGLLLLSSYHLVILHIYIYINLPHVDIFYILVTFIHIKDVYSLLILPHVFIIILLNSPPLSSLDLLLLLSLLSFIHKDIIIHLILNTCIHLLHLRYNRYFHSHQDVYSLAILPHGFIIPLSYILNSPLSSSSPLPPLLGPSSPGRRGASIIIRNVILPCSLFPALHPENHT